MESGTPSCVYRVDRALLELLDARLGPPLDSYVRGWQVWLEPNGPDGIDLEWRLHPPAGFSMPPGVNHHDLYDVVVAGVADGADPLPVGEERRALAQLWEALEVFPAFADPDEVEPAALVDAVTAVLGRRPDAAGRVDHARLGDLWKGKRGDYAVGRALLERLSPVDGAERGP